MKLHSRLAASCGVAALLCLAAAGPARAADAFNLDALIDAAKKEKPINVYDSTGKIVEQATAFAKKYGVGATGIKVNAQTSLEMVIRESQAKNVKGDVIMISDAPAGIAQLVPKKFAESWIPPDMVDQIPQVYRNPLAVSSEANLWAYNTEVNQSCPATNMWEFTEAKWKGKVAIYDPLNKAVYADWFNQVAMHQDSRIADAYKAYYGKDLKTGEKSAMAAWVKAFAANGPLVTDADEKISEAVGAAGQKAPFMGLLSSAKFRDNKDLGYKLGLCADMSPWPGYQYMKLALIATGTQSPNAAKLFVHYFLTQEGQAPQIADGKIPTNPKLTLPADEPSGVGKVVNKLSAYNTNTALKDFDDRQDWQDFWRVNYKK